MNDKVDTVDKLDKVVKKTPAALRKRSRKPRGVKSEKEVAPPVLCLICAEDIVFSAIAPCNNTTCHKCCLRQRALYKKRTCLVCRTDHAIVVVADRVLPEDTRCDDIVNTSAPFNAEHGLRFTSSVAESATLALLDILCPECHVVFPRFSQLNDHVRTHRGRQFCDICASHQCAFVSELRLYTQKELQRHVAGGDTRGFSGHPRCNFCRNKRFYSADELAVHVRDRHERCYLCDQHSPAPGDYYCNYDDLYAHFRRNHHVCLVPLCVEKRFVVFSEDLNLAAHMLREHGEVVSKLGRLVVGASAVGFLDRLSTVPVATPRVDIDTQCRRLEERAKHYLHGDEPALIRFLLLHQTLKAKKVSAQDAVAQLREIFAKTFHEDLALLVHEMVCLFPPHLDQGVQLQAAFDRTRPVPQPALHNHFPALGGSSKASPMLSEPSWGGSLRPKTHDKLFPALAKPQRPISPVIKNAPIRYTTVKEKPAGRPVVSVRIFQQKPKAFQPSYLERPHTIRSSSAFPALGSGSGASSRSQSPSTSAAPSSTLSDKQFPALAKKKRPIIPPVKPVLAAPTTWGLGLTAPEPRRETDWGIPIVHKKAEKLRLKQERAKKKDSTD
ncbi:hypothetical protein METBISCDRAFT_13854 [Metschnikowia bicuspidata]|uniref:Uncharacterized protein n=1 Tax=Metschnikowia bicuspidata TaxID=27322 RepID=A0A4P9ZGI3_9ASCO|nr:hypothetical protein METBISCDRAFT_13854 [Metschnikowia bicuspidata]